MAASIFVVASLSVGAALLYVDTSHSGWHELRCGLWANDNGDIGLKTTRAVSDAKIETFYLTRTTLGDGASLKSIVDTETFHYIGASFYKDKNHIYNYFPMSDGGSFYPLDDIVDYATFGVFEGSCYARDKNSIYVEKHVLIRSHVDYQTFHVMRECLGQDRYGFILWEDRTTEDDAKEYLKVLNEKGGK